MITRSEITFVNVINSHLVDIRWYNQVGFLGDLATGLLEATYRTVIQAAKIGAPILSKSVTKCFGN